MPKPSLGQSVLCVGGILGLQGALNWMDQASNSDLTWVALGVVAFWVLAFWLRRRGRDDRNPR